MQLNIICTLDLQLPPRVGQMLIRHRATRLANDVAIPARVVVQVDDALGAGIQARLHQRIVLGEICGVEVDAELVVRQVLPCDGQAEDVQSEVVPEVLHLPDTVGATILGQGRVDLADVGAAVFEDGEVEAGCGNA